MTATSLSFISSTTNKDRHCKEKQGYAATRTQRFSSQLNIELRLWLIQPIKTHSTTAFDSFPPKGTWMMDRWNYCCIPLLAPLQMVSQCVGESHCISSQQWMHAPTNQPHPHRPAPTCKHTNELLRNTSMRWGMQSTRTWQCMIRVFFGLTWYLGREQCDEVRCHCVQFDWSKRWAVRGVTNQTQCWNHCILKCTLQGIRTRIRYQGMNAIQFKCC